MSFMLFKRNKSGPPKGLRRRPLYLRLLLGQTGPQDEQAGSSGSQFRLFEGSVNSFV